MSHLTNSHHPTIKPPLHQYEMYGIMNCHSSFYALLLEPLFLLAAGANKHPDTISSSSSKILPCNWGAGRISLELRHLLVIRFAASTFDVSALKILKLGLEVSLSQTWTSGRTTRIVIPRWQHITRSQDAFLLHRILLLDDNDLSLSLFICYSAVSVDGHIVRHDALKRSHTISSQLYTICCC